MSYRPSNGQNRGIRDRDYMKRLNDDNVRPMSNSEVESFFDDLLRRHPRLLLGIVLVLAAVILIAVIVAKISGNPG